jgi:hypothetical protein
MNESKVNWTNKVPREWKNLGAEAYASFSLIDDDKCEVAVGFEGGRPFISIFSSVLEVEAKKIFKGSDIQRISNSDDNSINLLKKEAEEVISKLRYARNVETLSLSKTWSGK